jgi:hypothetical protein
LEEAAERFGGFGRCRKIEMIGRRSQKDLEDFEKEVERFGGFGRGDGKIWRIWKKQEDLEHLEEAERFGAFGRGRKIWSFWNRKWKDLEEAERLK